MRTYTIGEVADRTGFSASALRYYEGIGLVTPASRTGAGYRLYDDDTLARLAFIARAKQLGCSLEEITHLVSIWDGERCGPVQRRFHELVTQKITAARRHVAELVALTAQLQAAAAQLSEPATDGPCGDDCACITVGGAAAEAAMSPVPVSLTAKAEPPAIACTLDAGSMPDRLAEWQAILGHARSREALDAGGVRVEFAPGLPIGDLARLAAAEHGCCSFFSFALTIDQRGIGLDVSAPEGAEEIVLSMLGAPPLTRKLPA